MNIFSFPFYESIRQQTRLSRCAKSTAGALIAPASRWLPFMLTLPKTGEGLDCVNIWDAVANEIYSFVLPDAFRFDAFSDKSADYIFYYGTPVTGLNLPCGGQFYLEIKGLFSEVFTVTNDLDQYVKIEWSHKLPIAPAIYQTGFTNKLYLDAIISSPTYPYTEEGENDNYGVFQPTRSRVDKTYKFDSTPLPEFLIDALSAMPLHSSISIDGFNNCRDVKVTPDYETAGTDGCTAVMKIEFSEDRPLEADYCGTPAKLEEIDLSGYTPKTWLCTGGENTGPNWINTETPPYCEKQSGKYQVTGYLIQEQIDDNSASPTYGQTRQLRTKNLDACPIPVPFSSVEIKEIVYANNCGDNGNDSNGVEYRLPAGFIVDETSQKDVDDRAREYFDSNKQEYANDHSNCYESRTCIYEGTGCFSGRMRLQDGSEVGATAQECLQCFVPMADDNIYYCTSCN
jgi:hypothetical protein